MSYKKANGKKFISIFICAVAILIATCIAVPFFSKEEGYRMITVFEVSGTVGVVKDGIEYEAYPGMHLQEGHVIVTSEDSYARLVLDDDKYVKVEAGSRLEFETLGLLGTNKTRLKLDRGAITTEIVNPLGADEEYVVNTPNAVLAVRGTFFRVDLRVTPNGEIDTNVYTYGGKVASNRVMPTGEMIEEEVIVDAGYMTAIRMDAVETIYIVGMAELPTGEPVEETRKNTVPIEAGEIPDEDLVDMYFASKNGHEMFLSTDEIKENIEDREISIEEQAPVYDKANEVKEQEESNTENTTSTALIPDDRGDWEEDTEVAVEDTDEPQQEVVEDVKIEEDAVAEVEDEVVPEEVVQETPEQVVVVTPVVPPASTEEPEAEEPHDHSYNSKITKSATCTEDGEKTYSCTCGDIYTEAISATGHTEENGGTAAIHTQCSECGEILSSTHAYTLTEKVAAGCETTGYDTYDCACGYRKVVEHAPVGHVVDNTGVVTTPATCTTEGVLTKSCGNCGEIMSTEAIPAIGHTEENGGTYAIHTKCSECGVTISSTHPTSSYTLTERIEVGCETTGYDTYTCSCGYEEVIEHAPVGHVVDNTGFVTTEATCTTDGVLTKSCGNCGWIESTETIPAYGHTEGTPVVTQEATCTVEGIKTTSCVSCGEVLNTETISATGHTGIQGGTELAHEICSVCGETTSSTHSFTRTVGQEPNCINGGDAQNICDCGYWYMEDIPANGHTLADETAAETKCTVCQEDLFMLDSRIIPDTVLLNYIKTSGVDTNNDGMIAGTETFGIGEIIIGDDSVDMGVTDLTGLERFTALTRINLRNNAGITSVNLSTQTYLSSINFSGCTGLTELNVSNCTYLNELNIAGTNITTIDVSNCTSIMTLNVSGCESLKTLNVSNCTNLSTIDVSTCTNLSEIYTGGQFSLGAISFIGLTDDSIIKD